MTGPLDGIAEQMPGTSRAEALKMTATAKSAIAAGVITLALLAGWLALTSGASHTTGPIAPTAGHTTGPIGPASGGVEYVCEPSGAGAAIAAVEDGAGNWQCASSYFDQKSTIELGWHFVCIQPTSNGAPPQYGKPSARAVIGSFIFASNPPGTFYGAYCPATLDVGDNAYLSTEPGQ